MLAHLSMEMVVLNLHLIKLDKPFLRLQSAVILSGFKQEPMVRVIYFLMVLINRNLEDNQVTILCKTS